jgi:predicted amidohydrolase
MQPLRIALAQIRSEKGDWPGNLERAERYMAQARDQGCGVIVFPEMYLSGYCDPARFPDAVRPLDSEGIDKFVRLTGKHGIAASAGFIERNPGGKPFISQVLAQGGRLVGSYRKRHVVDEEADWFSPGDHTPIFKLKLPEGEIVCALAVCADSDNPDVFRDAALGGAKIVLHSSAPGLYGRRTDEASWQAGFDWYKTYLADRLPSYARDYGLYIAVATQTGATVDEDFPGGSFIFGPDGECLAASPDYSEMLLVHDIELTSNE